MVTGQDKGPKSGTIPPKTGRMVDKGIDIDDRMTDDAPLIKPPQSDQPGDQAGQNDCEDQSCLRNNTIKFVIIIAMILLLIAAAVAVPLFFTEGNPTGTTAIPTEPATSSTAAASCPEIQLSNHLIASCSSQRNIGSICSFSCEDGFHLEGPSNTTCISSLEWSASIPACCSTCNVGRNCMESISWKVLESYVTDVPFCSFSAKYASFDISCQSSAHIDRPFVWRYDCSCTDKQSGLEALCQQYMIPQGSCENALAQLVRTMVNLTEYPQPCDPTDMPEGC